MLVLEFENMQFPESRVDDIALAEREPKSSLGKARIQSSS